MSLRPGEETAAAGSGRPGEHTDWLGVAFGLALSCFVAFQQFKLPPVLPSLLQEFHYPRALAASFMSVYALVGLVASVPLGQWLKRRGYHAGLPLGLASTAIGLILALTLARYGTALLAARALEGLTYAIFAIAGPVIATASARFRDLPLVTGLLAGWIPVGQIGAGLLALAAPAWQRASQAFGLADWQVIWLIALALTLLLGLFAWHYSHHKDVGTADSHAKAKGTVTADTEWPEKARLQPSVGASLASQSPAAPHLSAASPDAKTAADGTAGKLAWSAWLGPRLPELLAAGTFLLWSGQYFAFMTWLTQYLIEQHGLQPQQAVLVYLLPVVVLLAFNLLTGWALGRGLALLPALVGALVLQGLVWALTPILGDVTGIAALLVYGICAGIIPTCLFHLPHHIASHRADHRAAAGGAQGPAKAGVKAGPEAFAILMTGRNIGVFCGPLLLPQLLAWLGDWNLAARVIAVITCTGALLVIALARHFRRPATA